MHSLRVYVDRVKADRAYVVFDRMRWVRPETLSMQRNRGVVILPAVHSLFRIAFLDSR